MQLTLQGMLDQNSVPLAGCPSARDSQATGQPQHAQLVQLAVPEHIATA